MGHFERKFHGKGSSTNEFWRQESRLPELTRGVVCVIIRLAVFSKRQRITLRLLYAIGRPSVVCLSVLCDVGAPYSGG